MDIFPAGVRVDISAQRELWSLVKARRVAQAERQEGQAFVEERLASLLLGQDLNPGQQADYVRRLAGTAALAAQLGEGLDVPDISPARIPREKLLFKAGGVTWRPFPVTQRQVAVTPLQRRLQDRLALALRNKMAAAPESVRTCVYAAGIAVGSHQMPWDEDRIELSGWGMEILAAETRLRQAPILPAPQFLFATVAPLSTQ